MKGHATVVRCMLFAKKWNLTSNIASLDYINYTMFRTLGVMLKDINECPSRLILPKSYASLLSSIRCSGFFFFSYCSRFIVPVSYCHIVILILIVIINVRWTIIVNPS